MVCVLAIMLIICGCGCIYFYRRRGQMENNRVIYTSSPGLLQTHRPNGEEHTRANNNNPYASNINNRHTPSAPPDLHTLGTVYSIPADTSSEKPPEVSFNPPTYQEATTDNIYWDPRTNTDNKY